jgi:hypothetical protein
LKALFVPILGEVTLLGIVAFIIGLVLIWVIVSIPVYIVGRFVAAGKSTLGDTMIATMFGPIIYATTLFLVDYFLGALTGSGSHVWALVLALVIAFIGWVWVFKVSFKTSWLRALAISLLAILVFAAISLLFGFWLGVMMPIPFFPVF